MTTRRFAAILATGAVTTVACVLGVTYLIDRRAALTHAEYRASRGGAQ
jgi:hypothetical protein